MTVMIGASAAAPPPADTAPPADGPSGEGSPSFGPALSRARQEGDGDPARAEDSGGDAQFSQSNQTTALDGESPAASHEDPVTVAAAFAQTPTAGKPAVLDHPTAKGAIGVGGPSIDPTLEAAATPDSPDEPIAGDVRDPEVESRTAEISQAMNEGSGAEITQAMNEGSGAEISQPMKDGSGADQRVLSLAGADLTSNRVVAPEPVAPVLDTDTASPPPPPVEEVLAGVASPEKAIVVEATHSERLQLAPSPAGDTVAVEADDRAPITESRLQQVDADDPEPAPTKVGLPVDGPEAGIGNHQPDVVASAEPRRSDGIDAVDVRPPAAVTPSTSEAADTVVVLAREASRGVDVSRPAAGAAPTPGPLDSAEGSLWDDVRLAFDRVRSTGDGQEVRIRLRPAELGELMVQVKTQGDHVAVRLMASSSAAQQALIDDRLRLATELARAGFEEGSVDISQQQNDAPGSGDQRASDGRGRGRTIPEPHHLDGRPVFERRDPIRTESVFRPGRHAYSTISLTL